VDAHAQVKAFVELVGSLLSASGGKAGAGGSGQAGLSGEMMRAMRWAGVIPVLINALRLLDLDHPNVCLHPVL
jgi:hypothetical protein